MEELIKKMFENAKSDKTSLIKLKNMAVASQNFELASELRKLEIELFPKSEEEESARNSAKELKTMFGMVELNVSEDVCWLINETIKEYNKSKELFDLKTASCLIARKNELFYK